jgi:signal transduction histidine kinase
MGGTNYSIGGIGRITRMMPPVKIRFWGFIVLVLGGGVLMTWITYSTWEQLDRLQKEHAAVRSESFYMGVTLRGSIRSLNEKLLQFGHTSELSVRDEFLHESSELKPWLITNRVYLAELAKLPLLKQMLVDDFDILNKIQTEYDLYLAEAGRLLESGNERADHPSFEDRYNRVRGASRNLLRLCDELVKAQREDFTDFLAETQATLTSHQRLLKLTLTLIVTLAGGLAMLVYRGMITPLRLGLDQSRTIIERQEKLASLGVLASGVAHEIRNPLTALKMRLFSLKRAVPIVAENEDLGIISNEINRLERIVKDFLHFARPSPPELATLPAAHLLREVHDLLKPQLDRSSIELRMRKDANPWIRVDPQQMKQVLINLIQNSAENIGRDGAITLRLRCGTGDFDGRSQPAVILAVEDSGKGILPEVEMRLFDPFFTTKEGGTGLGLAIAARIVEKHGGLLRYETEINHGTVFEIVLPEARDYATEIVTD